MKFIVTLLLALLTFATVDAAKVDMYREALKNRTFTLKYKVNEFPVRIINKEAEITVNQFKTEVVDAESVGKTAVNTGGIIVVNKDDNYIENSHESYTENVSAGQNERRIYTIKEGGSCILKKDGEFFQFQFDVKDGEKKYYSSHSLFGKNKKVKAKTDAERYKNLSPYQVLFNDYNFGNASLYQALQAILPPELVIATPNTPIFEFIGEGTLKDGLSYEDFYGEKDNFYSAVRYYFDGDKMVKIATFNYIKDKGVVQSYEKHVIDIEEFLTAADEKYLQLPEGFKDTTKRKDGDKK